MSNFELIIYILAAYTTIGYLVTFISGVFQGSNLRGKWDLVAKFVLIPLLSIFVYPAIFVMMLGDRMGHKVRTKLGLEDSW